MLQLLQKPGHGGVVVTLGWNSSVIDVEKGQEGKRYSLVLQSPIKPTLQSSSWIRFTSTPFHLLASFKIQGWFLFNLDLVHHFAVRTRLQLLNWCTCI